MPQPSGKQPKLYLTRGLPAAGKSTCARALVAAGQGRVKRVAKEDLRAMLDNDRYFDDQWPLVERCRDAVIETLLAAGFDVVCDETMLPLGSVERVRNRFGGMAEIEVLDFIHVPLSVCLARDARRERPVGESTIREYVAMLSPEEQAMALGDG